jgi:DNA-directed RNA polymerase alpha subunit
MKTNHDIQKIGDFFSTKQANYLRREGVHTIEDMLRLRERDLIDMPMIGDKTIDKIREIRNRCLGKVTTIIYP